jgi:aspartate aminotransferase
MLTLSRKIPGGAHSQTALIAERARRLTASGRQVANLTAGDPDFPVPRHIKEAAIIAVEQNRSRYAPNQGVSELLAAIQGKFSRENGLHFEPDQLLISNGAKQCVFNALQALCNKGDEVVLIAPHCPDYPEMVRLVDAVPIVVRSPLADGFIPDARAIRRAVNQKTKAILLNSPNNPSGRVYPRSLLEEIAAIARECGVFVISDELYEKLILGDGKHVSIGSVKSVRDQVITINGMSMAYAMSGWRIGYMGGPRSVIEAAAALQAQMTFSANSIAQYAALAAFSGTTQPLDGMILDYRRRRDFVLDQLATVPHISTVQPEGAFFVFFGVDKYFGKKAGGVVIRHSMDLALYLLESHDVATSPGVAFGDDNCLRISYACSTPELESGVAKLKAGFASLQ